MQIKEVADVLGVEKSDVISEVENVRSTFESGGYKLAKKLTAASSLHQDIAAQVMANFDIRKQREQEQEKAKDERRIREEAERRRAAEDIERKKAEEERQARAEAARKQAEAELARRQAEQARQQAEAARAAAAAAMEAQKAAAAAPPPPAPGARTVSPQLPTTGAPAGQPAPQQRPPAPSSAPRAAIPTARPGERPPVNTPPSQRPGQYPQQQRTARPDDRGGRPPQRPDDRFSRGPGSRPPEGGRPPRRDGGPPMQRREGGPPPRRDGGPSYPRRDGGAPPPRRPGDERPAAADRLKAFVDKGMDSDVVDEYKKTQARRPKSPKAADQKNWRDKDKGKDDDSRGKRPVKGGPADAHKRIRPSQIFNIEAGGGERRHKSRRKPQGGGGYRQSRPQQPPEVQVAKFHGDFTLGEFAEKTGIAIPQVMGKLIQMGKMLTINHLLEPDLAEELAIDFNVEIEIARESDDSDIARYLEESGSEEDYAPRPPVVTVMGHVDHGKTSLLDAIRKADVASSEHGGITQHIGAYHVNTDKGSIVFLDTPGHEAFTEMRSRGANVTDLVVLVVAANDGVMPQTVEAISHAKAANVPILVAINKIDVDGANLDRVRQELMRHELVPEEYGGDTIMIPVSAITKEGIDSLLEYIALQTEVMELKANPKRSAHGTVVESHVDPFRGAVATVLVEQGTLRVGDCFIAGTESGRVRSMRDDRDQQIEEAAPTVPVEILGFSGSPAAGEKFVVVPTEADAREIAEKRRHRRKNRKAVLKQHINLDNLSEHLTDDSVLQLNIILKTDVQGSLEAVSNALMKIRSDKVLIKILHAGVGAVSLSDVQLADASEAVILSFNVGVDPASRDAAEESGVDIRTYRIIYALLEDIQKAMMGMLKPEYQEKEEGRAVVQTTFKVSKVGTVAGCMVEDGSVAISHKARLLRGGTIIWSGKLRSLRRVKDDVKEVLSGVECGIGLEGYNDIKDGDIIETYSLVEQEATLIISDTEKKPASV